MTNRRHFDRKEKRAWRKIRIKKRMSGSEATPRLCVFKSRKYVYVQAVDDASGKTLATASSLEPSVRSELKSSGKHMKVAEKVGELISERLKAKGIESIVFDRGGYLYHGRVKAIADGARKGGLKF
jgi:large subunit ribosomal protein L18